jgi:anti-sigma-K factor RskA
MHQGRGGRGTAIGALARKTRIDVRGGPHSRLRLPERALWRRAGTSPVLLATLAALAAAALFAASTASQHRSAGLVTEAQANGSAGLASFISGTLRHPLWRLVDHPHPGVRAREISVLI